MTSKSMSKLLLLLLILLTVQCQRTLKIGENCVIVIDGVNQVGVCQRMEECASVMGNSNTTKFEHNVCGNERQTQIICCPKLNIQNFLGCNLANSNETGIIKFLSDCPVLNIRDAGTDNNKLCTDAICSDLVCCPARATSLGRLKNVCWNFDHPFETLEMRLLLNQECTVKELNIMGRYQPSDSCKYAERNPHLIPMLKDVCSDKYCGNWYCCPIEDNDEFLCTAGLISLSTAILVGPKCIDSKTQRKGVCKQSKYCAHSEVSELDRCGSYCNQNYYCCPSDQYFSNETKSIRECLSYKKYYPKREIEVEMNLYVNRTSNDIKEDYGMAVGGRIAEPGEYPHMAAIGYKANLTIKWNCGGSLISDRYVLSAAHCLISIDFGPVYIVRLGVIDLLNDVETKDCPEDFDVVRLIPHPEYNRRYVYNDIALIELATPVKFNFHIRPLCLPTSDELLQTYKSMGWGAMGYAEESSVKLIIVNQKLFSYDECKIQYNIDRKLPRGIMNDTQICAGSRDTDESTCAGDSGGPLLSTNYGSYVIHYIHGIVSFGLPCRFLNTAGVYTKVFPYLNWIEEIVWTI